VAIGFRCLGSRKLDEIVTSNGNIESGDRL